MPLGDKPLPQSVLTQPSSVSPYGVGRPQWFKCYLILSEPRMSRIFIIEVARNMLFSCDQAALWMVQSRVHSRQGNVREKWNFSRSGNCQGILQSVREILTFAKLMKNVMEFHIMSGKMTHFRQHDSPDSMYIDQTAKSRLGNFLK